jgi:hypothetical protein
LLDLLTQLKDRHYNFVAVSPSTHAIVLARAPARPLGLRDIFGWNRPFDAAELDAGLLSLLELRELSNKQDQNCARQFEWPVWVWICCFIRSSRPTLKMRSSSDQTRIASRGSSVTSCPG